MTSSGDPRVDRLIEMVTAGETWASIREEIDGGAPPRPLAEVPLDQRYLWRGCAALFRWTPMWFMGMVRGRALMFARSLPVLVNPDLVILVPWAPPLKLSVGDKGIMYPLRWDDGDAALVGTPGARIRQLGGGKAWTWYGTEWAHEGQRLDSIKASIMTHNSPFETWMVDEQVDWTDDTRAGHGTIGVGRL